MGKYLWAAMLASVAGALFSVMVMVVLGIIQYLAQWVITPQNALMSMLLGGAVVGGLLGLAQPRRFLKWLSD